jgi:hypothetical protein
MDDRVVGYARSERVVLGAVLGCGSLALLFLVGAASGVGAGSASGSG